MILCLSANKLTYLLLIRGKLQNSLPNHTFQKLTNTRLCVALCITITVNSFLPSLSKHYTCFVSRCRCKGDSMDRIVVYIVIYLTQLGTDLMQGRYTPLSVVGGRDTITAARLVQLSRLSSRHSSVAPRFETETHHTRKSVKIHGVMVF